MVSPDSDLRYHHQEPMTPFAGDFAGRDILSPRQFDKRSRDKLFSVAEQMNEPLRARYLPPLLRGTIIISSYKESVVTTWFPFESAILFLGGTQPIHQEFPDPQGPEFDYRILDMKASRPDAIFMSHPQEAVLTRAAEVLRSVEGNSPLINVGIFDNIKYGRDLRWKDYKEVPDDIPLRMALLALVLGKIK